MPEFIVGLKRRTSAHSVSEYSGNPNHYERSHEYVIGPFPDGESADLFRQFADRGSQSFKLLLEVIKACQRKPNKLKAMLLNDELRPKTPMSNGNVDTVAVPQLPSPGVVKAMAGGDSLGRFGDIDPPEGGGSRT